MEFAEVVRRRRMVRVFDPDRPVPADIADRLVAVATRAPSAGFSQGTSLLVIDDAAGRDRFWTASTIGPGRSSWLDGMRRAPLLIMIWTSRERYLERYAEPDKGWIDRDENRWAAPFWYVDAGMAAMSLLHAVVDADDGLGACFFGVPPTRTEVVREAFGVPAEQLVVGVVAVGYRAAGERPSGSPVTRRRRPPDEVVHRNYW